MNKRELQQKSYAQLLKLARRADSELSPRLTKAELVDRLLNQTPHSTPDKPLQPLTRLPESYGLTHLTLLEIDPSHLHVFWEIAPPDREQLFAQPGVAACGTNWILRFEEVVSPDSTKAASDFDIPIDPKAGNWYVELPAPGKSYRAEIGVRTSGGAFKSLRASNTAVCPPAAASDHYKPQWMEMPQPPPVQAAPEEPTSAEPSAAIEVSLDQKAPESPLSVIQHEEITEPSREPVPAQFPIASPPLFTQQSGQELPVLAPAPPPTPLWLSGSDSPAPVTSPSPHPQHESAEGNLNNCSSSWRLGDSGAGNEPSIDLELNAEVIVHGRAQPGQTLRVNGRVINVNADGTFRVQWALPLKQA